jgi:hypothetical protein
MTRVFDAYVSYKKLFLFGFYSYSRGSTNAEGYPADPYNLRAEWGLLRSPSGGIAW